MGHMNPFMLRTSGPFFILLLADETTQRSVNFFKKKKIR